MPTPAVTLARPLTRARVLGVIAVEGGDLFQTAKPRAPAPVRIALVHIALGETDRAFEWLEKAIEARDWQMALLNVEPAFDLLRSDQRFAALVERVGLPR